MGEVEESLLQQEYEHQNQWALPVQQKEKAFEVIFLQQ